MICVSPPRNDRSTGQEVPSKVQVRMEQLRRYSGGAEILPDLHNSVNACEIGNAFGDSGDEHLNNGDA